MGASVTSNLQPSVERFKLNDIKKEKVIPMSITQLDLKGLTMEQVQDAIDKAVIQENSRQFMVKYRAEQKERNKAKAQERGRRTRIVNAMVKLGVPVNPIKTDYSDSNRHLKMNVSTQPSSKEESKGSYQLSMDTRGAIEFHKYLDILRKTLVFKITEVQVGNYMGGSENPIYTYYIRFMGDN